MYLGIKFFTALSLEYNSLYLIELFFFKQEILFFSHQSYEMKMNQTFQQILTFILLEFPDESISIFLNFVRKSEEAQEWFTFNNSIIWVSLEGWGTQGNLLYPYILHPHVNMDPSNTWNKLDKNFKHVLELFSCNQ